MRTFIRPIAVLAFAALNSFGALAATKDEVIKQVNTFVAHAKKAGVDQAIKDANTGAEWKTGGMNVVVTAMNGVVIASSLNEKLIGKETLEMKDPSGKAFVKEFVATAQKGEGWVDYQFINPQTKKLEERSMFVKKLPGYDGFVGVAATKQ